MTAHPNILERRGRPVCAAVGLLLVMVSALLVTGCIGCILLPTGCIEPGYVANHDIAVVKLTPNGSLSWYKVINTGGDDTTDDIIPTRDAGFVISARLSDLDRHHSLYPYLIKISRDGNFIWNQSLFELYCDSGTLVTDKNGEIVTISGNQVCRFNADGKWISNGTLDTINNENVIIPTNEGGYIIAGITEEKKPFTKEEFISSGGSVVSWEELCGNTTPPVNLYCGGNQTIIHTNITKMDQNDRPEWSRSLKEYGFSRIPLTVIELKNNRGYLVQVINITNYVCSVHLDVNGNFIKSTPYAIYNNEGHAIARSIFNNTSTIITQTNDGDYLSAGFPGSTLFLESYLYHSGTDGNLHVVKLSSEGTLQWDMAVPNVTVNKVKKIIQTTDGGYVILCENDKFSSLK